MESKSDRITPFCYSTEPQTNLSIEGVLGCDNNNHETPGNSLVATKSSQKEEHKALTQNQHMVQLLKEKNIIPKRNIRHSIKILMDIIKQKRPIQRVGLSCRTKRI